MLRLDLERREPVEAREVVVRTDFSERGRVWSQSGWASGAAGSSEGHTRQVRGSREGQLGYPEMGPPEMGPRTHRQRNSLLALEAADR